VTNDGAGTLARIDPRTNRVTRRVRLEPGVFSVTHGFGALWVVNYKRNTLTRVDPSSMRAHSVRVGAVPDGLLAAYGRVWVAAWEAGRLVEVDPRSLKVVRRTRIGPRPSGLRAAAGGVWVGFGRSATAVARVDPRTHRTERVRVGVRAAGRGAFFPLRAFGSMWVTSYAGSDVWRFKPAER
jgi:virginiamycin B lyase